jgi:hypothetical protein
MTRRIKKQLKDFFDKQTLTDKERQFIIGCIRAQNKYPQLTQRQWDILMEIKERYSNVENTRSEETSERKNPVPWKNVRRFQQTTKIRQTREEGDGSS